MTLPRDIAFSVVERFQEITVRVFLEPETQCRVAGGTFSEARK